MFEDPLLMQRSNVVEKPSVQEYGPDEQSESHTNDPKPTTIPEAPIAMSTAAEVSSQGEKASIVDVEAYGTPVSLGTDPEDFDETVTHGEYAEEVDEPEVYEPQAVDWKARVLSRPLLVSVGEFDFEDFKNRWGEDAGYHVVELLMGSDKSPDEIRKEDARRRSTLMKRGQRQDNKTKVSSSETWIQRVRVHSPIVLHYLQEAMNAPNWNTEQPRVFFRPFKCLIHYHYRMKKALEDLEKRVADAKLPGTQNVPTDSTVSDGVEPSQDGKYEQPRDMSTENDLYTTTVVEDAGYGSGDNNTRDVNCPEGDTATTQGPPYDKNTTNADDIDILNGETALNHLRCYVDFVDQRLMPLQDMFNGTDRHMVRFNDLWFLFKVGDVIHYPIKTAVRDSRSDKSSKGRGRYQTALKIDHKSITSIVDSTPDDLIPLRGSIGLWCYYVDHDGESYGPVMVKVNIGAFSGLMDIRELAVYPLRFAPNAEKLRSELELQAKSFRTLLKQKNVFCEGWTLTAPPMGTSEGNYEESPEHVESDVIIDFAEAGKRHPSWKPEFEVPHTRWNTVDDWEQGVDAMNIFHWPSPEENSRPIWPLFSIEEITQRDDDVEEKTSKAGVEVNAFFKAFQNGVVESLDGLDEDKNNLLLPRRFFVYVLRQRHFAMVDTVSLNVVPPQSTIFDDLRIDSNHKLIVQSLVADHFEKRRLQRQRSIISPMNQDLVRGKGSGLFILLHGVPGVGKTATAEAVAQANNKPLFTITCGDLGLTPEAVDSKLNEVFRLAQLWDCVLLLDEADIFLARRDTFNLKRNALVSVFLRVLEYYSGILFLTTNRVGIIDEAFKSRIHISLYYEPLSRHQTIEIFRVNIRKLRAIEDEKQRQLQGSDVQQPRLLIRAKGIIEYAQQYYDENEDTPHLRWNGRQIRNAFQIASSLAHYNIRRISLARQQSDPSSVGQVVDSPVLDETQFDKVAEAIERFGNYMDYTKAMTDADQARLDAVRADDIRNDDLTPRKRGYNTFGVPPAAAPAQDRRPVGDSYRQRRTPVSRETPPQTPKTGHLRNVAVHGKGKAGVQSQPGRNISQTQSGGPRMRERPAGSFRQPQGRSAAPGRANPTRGPPRRPAAPVEPVYDEDYEEDEGDNQAGGAEAGFYEGHEGDMLQEEDVDDYDEGEGLEGQLAELQGDVDDYDD